MDTQTAIQRAADEVGGQSALSKAISVTPAVVWQWVNGRRPVAARHCLPIEQATDGKVTRHDLRPDVFGPAPQPAAKRRQPKKAA